jgi:putative transposase
VARFSYNWALTRWKEDHKAGLKPTEAALRRHLNAVKRDQFPWMLQVTKSAPQQAIINLGRAFSNFFEDLELHKRGDIDRKRIRIPKFKQKGVRDRFRADNGPRDKQSDAVLVDTRRVKLPFIGWVAMRESVRFAGRILSVTISHQANSWYASFTVEAPYEVDARYDTSVVGVDLGISAYATLSDGSPKIQAQRPLLRHLQRIRRLSRSLARKNRHSRNRAKAKTKLARLHRKIAQIRGDALHKLTSGLTRFRTIVIEDLNVKGLLGNTRISRAIADLGLFEFRRQLGYKVAMAGSTLVIADRWFPSSKLCSTCGLINRNLRLSERTWTCVSCGSSHDRDVNAARNLALYAESSPVSARGAEGAGGDSLSRRETSGVEAGTMA